MSDSMILPGDVVSLIEEYEAGENTFDDGNVVRAAAVGQKSMDKATRVASIRHPKMLSVPKEGDIVTGAVAAVMASMMAISVDYINGSPTVSQVECICSTRNIRRKNIALVNDIVRVKVVSHLNGAIHASINEPDLGVIFTKCRKCGGGVVPMRDAIKCTECAWIDERKLASTFGKNDFANLEG